MSRSMLAVSLILCLGLACAAGCGQKGDLYLEPEQPAPTESGNQEQDEDTGG